MQVKLKKIVLLIFAILGAVSLLIHSYFFFKNENEAKAYRRNCRIIRTGMPIVEAKKLMGDYDWFNKSTRSEIWIEDNKNDSRPEFYLSYPAVFGASSWPMIYFDPNTMTVTRVICGE